VIITTLLIIYYTIAAALLWRFRKTRRKAYMFMSAVTLLIPFFGAFIIPATLDTEAYNRTVPNFEPKVNGNISPEPLPGDPSEQTLETRVRFLLKAGNKQAARHALDRLEVYYPENENLIYYRLQAAAQSGAVGEFCETVERLQNNPDITNSEHYGLVKFFAIQKEKVN
jgi:hypothetical protein